MEMTDAMFTFRMILNACMGYAIGYLIGTLHRIYRKDAQ